METATQDAVEEKYEHVYYFKIDNKNPLMLVEVDDTINLNNTEIIVESTGQTTLDGEQHGFIAGEEVEQ